MIDPVDDVDESEDEDWKRLGLEQFFKDEAETDSIYDDLDKCPSEE